MNFKDQDVVRIVEMIWGSVLGMECVAVAEVPAPAAGTMAACVQITGAWQAAVVLCCPEAFAAAAAAAMFGSPAEDATATDMQDALAELVNMIGGNLKGVLETPDACQLSLPAVVAGADYTARVPGSRPLNRVAVRCGEHTLVVNVLEKLPAARAA